MKVALLMLCVALAGCAAPAVPEVRAGIGAVEAMAGVADSGWARATTPRPFRFPRDHGPHAEYAIEWWYFTGNLNAGERHFGYQLTIFRRGLAPQIPARASAWGAQLRLESADDPNLERFVSSYRKGPQTPEPGATCSGGTSDTVAA